MLAFWNEVPEGVGMVRIAFRGETRDVPVTDNVYLTAWWNVPSPGPFDWPRVLQYHIDGTWTPAPPSVNPPWMADPNAR